MAPSSPKTKGGGKWPKKIKFKTKAGEAKSISIDDFNNNLEGWDLFMQYRMSEKANQRAMRQKLRRAGKKNINLQSTIEHLEQQKDSMAAVFLQVNFFFITHFVTDSSALIAPYSKT